LLLQEKASVQEVLSRTSTRATTNFALASKLAEKIGQQQAEIMSLLGQKGTRSSSSSSSGVSTPPTAPPPQPSSSSSSGLYSYSRSGSSLTSSSSGYTASPSSSGSNGSSGSSSGGYEAPWEASLREARDRVAAAEAQATAAGQAASYKARETLEVGGGHLRGLAEPQAIAYAPLIVL